MKKSPIEKLIKELKQLEKEGGYIESIETKSLDLNGWFELKVIARNSERDTAEARYKRIMDERNLGIKNNNP